MMNPFLKAAPLMLSSLLFAGSAMAQTQQPIGYGVDVAFIGNDFEFGVPWLS